MLKYWRYLKVILFRSLGGKVTFLIILEVLWTTWNSEYFVHFWQYHYELTRTLTSLTTQTDLSRMDGWSRYFIPFEILMLKGIKPWYIPGYKQHHLYLTDNTSVIGNKREICQCNWTREILLKVDYVAKKTRYMDIFQ
jgi:hypothetical protein